MCLFNGNVISYLRLCSLYNRYKVGHLYKAVFDNGLRDDVSVDAAVIKIQSRLPNTVEFTNAKRTRIKSAGKSFTGNNIT